MSDLRFAIAGAGMIARYHAEAIARTPGARLVAIGRSNAEHAAESAAQFDVPCETSYEALVARPDVDVVCICTPSGLHAPQTIAAAQAGKHVLVEKPMALTPQDADAAIAACRAAGVTLGVALQRRTDPRFSAIKAVIDAGELGRLVLGNVSVPYTRPQSYYDSADWRGTWALDGGGALMNQGIHLVDLLLWYLGDVSEVRAYSATLAHTIEVEDCVTASLVFASGALGTLTATTAAAPGFPHRVEVYGDRAGLQIEGESIVRAESSQPDHAAITSLADPPGGAAVSAGAGASPTGISAEGHVRIVQDFVEAVRTGRPPLISGEEGRRSLALVCAIYESARSGRSVAPSTL